MSEHRAKPATSPPARRDRTTLTRGRTGPEPRPRAGMAALLPRVAAPITLALAMLPALAPPAVAQLDDARYGEAVPRDVREMYDRGMAYLAQSQQEAGDWQSSGTENGPGGTSIALLAFLASGEDPNFGLYSGNIRRALRSVINAQNESTGIMGDSMYHHGFSMLGLAEAYGAVDERDLWPDGKGPRSIGQALELAVRAAITSQKKNPLGAWRYSPDASDADTSVSGAVLVGLLAARNAGVEVPDESIDRAIAYYTSMTADSGNVGYSGGIGGMGESLARSSIAGLVYAIARRKDLNQFKSVLGYLTQNLEQTAQQWPEYTRYYQAQALFQGDLDAWEKWNTLLIRQLKQLQQPDGSFRGQFGAPFNTSMSLLALALNYRLLPIYER